VRKEGLTGAGDEVRVVERQADAVPLADLILALYFRDAAAQERVLASESLPERLRRRVTRAKGETV
jgi:hypothetical protein